MTVHDAGELGAGVVEHLLGLVQGVVSRLQRVHVRLAPEGGAESGMIWVSWEYESILFHKNPHICKLHFSSASKKCNSVDTPKNPIFPQTSLKTLLHPYSYLKE